MKILSNTVFSIRAREQIRKLLKSLMMLMKTAGCQHISGVAEVAYIYHYFDIKNFKNNILTIKTDGKIVHCKKNK